MQRIYQKIIQYHLENFRQMLFLVGPKQVGKTTLSLSAKVLGRDFFYLNYVNVDCFKTSEPVIVPAKTFLSQLV